MDIYFRHDYKCFNFRVAAIIKNENQILLKNRGDAWTLPGGRVKFGEMTEQAIKREIYEQLNIPVQVIKLLSINENFFAYGDDDYHEVLFVYHCELVNPQDFQYKNNNEKDYEYKIISDLGNLNLKPEFLLAELKKLPMSITHNVNK
jgi:ADP-ribose pyrophosphatase YjhB (NUDIX family)